MTTLTQEQTQPSATHARFNVPWPLLLVLSAVWLEVVLRLHPEWSANPQYSYGWTVPFLAAYLFWNRLLSAPTPAAPHGAGIAVGVAIASLLVLLPIRWLGEANPDWRLLSWGMAMAALGVSSGAIYLAGGLRWVRHFGFPILFFLVAVPWPSQIEQALIQGLMRAAATVNVNALTILGIPALQRGNVIELSTGLVGINDACSGIRSLQATLAVSLFFGEFYGFGLVRRLILIVSGAALAFLCNLVRTFLLVWIGATRSPDAIAGWHDPAGLVILMVCLFGLWGLSMLFQRGADPAEERRKAQIKPAGALRLPTALVAVVLGMLLLGEAATAYWYRPTEKHAAQNAWAVTWPKEKTSFKDIPVSEEAKDLLRYHDGGGGTWMAEEGYRCLMFFFKWLPGQTAALFIKNHRPDICLPASGLKQISDARRLTLKVNGVVLPVRAYEFDDRGQTLHVFYCYWDGSAPTTDDNLAEDWTPAGRVRSALNAKRDHGAQMLEIAVWGQADASEAEKAVGAQLSQLVRPQ